MSDTTESRVNAVCLYLRGSYSLYAAWTNHTADLSYDSKTFVSATEVDFSALASHSMNMDNDKCEIKNLPVGAQQLAINLKANYPYNEVGVLVYSFDLDGAGAVVPGTVWTLWKGILYSCKSYFSRDYISVLSRNDKYYTDVVAGLVCAEQCAVARFGDPVCAKAVHSEAVTINLINGLSVGFSSKPTGVNHLYRNGYLEYQGLEIKIRDWDDTPGTSCIVATSPPAAWLSQSVTIYAGCDKTYETCSVVHSNTEQMLPLGIAMVDYNTYFEMT